MTKDEIIRMAVKCELLTTANRDGVYAQALERFAALVAAHEREKQSEQEPVARENVLTDCESARNAAAAIANMTGATDELP